jgi:hypothetical protein
MPMRDRSQRIEIRQLFLSVHTWILSDLTQGSRKSPQEGGTLCGNVPEAPLVAPLSSGQVLGPARYPSTKRILI